MKIQLTFWRVVFLVIMALGIYSTYVRYLHGLGAVSNMTDQFPWGFWIGFDCLCGVMLAAGGFCMVGAVYLFNGQTGALISTLSGSNGQGFAGDEVGSGGVVALPSGNFLVLSPLWANILALGVVIVLIGAGILFGISVIAPHALAVIGGK